MLLFIHKIITEKVLQGKNMKLKQSENTGIALFLSGG